MRLDDITPTDDQVLDWLREQLPAAEFMLDHSPGGYMTLRGRLKVAKFEVGVDEVMPLPDADMHLQAALERIVKSVRQQAMTDYGLQPLIDEQVADARAEGYRAARDDLAKQLDAALDMHRDDAGLLPAELAIAGDWLRAVLR